MQHSELKTFALDFVNKTPFFLAIICISLAIVFELFFWRDKDQPLRGKLLNMANLFFVCFANCLMVYFLSALFDRLHIGLIDLSFVNHNLLTSLASILVLVFMGDLFYYFYHFTMHKVHYLWDIHAVHHSEKAFNVTMAVRRHWFEDPLQMLVVSVPMLLLFKLPTMDLPLAVFIYSFHVYFTHMNVRLQLGKYSGFITAPQLHRLHHSVLPEHHDTNFAQVFPVIDMVFGTYVAPKPNEFPPTGIDSGEHVDTLKKMLFWPFMQWKKKLNNSRQKQ